MSVANPNYTPRPPREKINNSNLLASMPNVKVRHFMWPLPNNRVGGYTVAFRRLGRNTVEASVAVCNASDTFSKKYGTRQALTNFQENKTIVMPTYMAFAW